MRRAAILAFVIGIATSAAAQDAPDAPDAGVPVLTLDRALRLARTRHPRLRQAAAQRHATRAQADEALAPLLPQIGFTGGYTRTTANFVSRPGTIPRNFAGQEQPSPSLQSFDFFQFNLTANQLVYDFGQTTGHYKAARILAEAQADTEEAVLLQVELDLRAAYFNARGRKRLVDVAREALDTQRDHLHQTEGFVSAGTRPQIDLAQARADYANARAVLINAENDYLTAKAQLNQAMGVIGSTLFEVAEDAMPPLDEELHAAEALTRTALVTRPELAAFDKRVRAQEATIRAIQGAYGPAIGVTSGASEAGTEISNMVWNMSIGATVTWPLFQGGLTRAQVREARANLADVEAQADIERLQVQLDVEQARLEIRAAKASLGALLQAAKSAAERLRLAEGRYAAGVGSAIERGDARVALTRARGEVVVAEFRLATARARLLAALGRHR
jgi:outer membrane protein